MLAYGISRDKNIQNRENLQAKSICIKLKFMHLHKSYPAIRILETIHCTICWKNNTSSNTEISKLYCTVLDRNISYHNYHSAEILLYTTSKLDKWNFLSNTAL